jgi:hypothetical protein
VRRRSWLRFQDLWRPVVVDLDRTERISNASVLSKLNLDHATL